MSEAEKPPRKPPKIRVRRKDRMPRSPRVPREIRNKARGPVTENPNKMIVLVEKLASIGLSRHQVRSIARLDKEIWREKYEEYFDRGHAKGVQKIAHALYSRAVNLKDREGVRAQIFYLKARAGWHETQGVRFEDDDGKVMVPTINLTISGGTEND